MANRYKHSSRVGRVSNSHRAHPAYRGIDADDWNVQGKLLWEPTERLSVLLAGSHVERDNSCCVPDATQGDAVQSLMAGGVPMGGVLRPDAAKQTSPGFFVWATRDPIDAPLQRVQMIKGWLDAQGQTHEKVVDIACADGLTVDAETGRCPDNGVSVDLETCSFSADSGANELKTLWHDPDYDANQGAFYYVRVLMNPTCRWSSYDAVRLGREPDPRVPSTIRERAWTSPIWLDPVR